VAALTEGGAQLTNADLQGLQRLRSIRERRLKLLAEQEKQAAQSPAPVARTDSQKKQDESVEVEKEQVEEAKKEEDEDAEDQTMEALLTLDGRTLWKGHRADGEGYTPMLAELGARMQAEAVLTDCGSRPHVPAPPGEDVKIEAGKFVEALIQLGVRDQQINASKMFALRAAAEGGGVSIKAAFVLSVYLSIEAIHRELMAAWAAACSVAATADEEDRWAIVDPLLVQVTQAIDSLPAARAVYFRSVVVPTTSGTAREFLLGAKNALNTYRVGSLVLWRGAAAVTDKPEVAEACSLAHPKGVTVIFKIRRAVSARRVSSFTAAPELGEALFPPCSFFRVMSLHELHDSAVRRGCEEGGRWDLDAAPPPVSLTWEQAGRQKRILVVLSEEERSSVPDFI